MIECVSNGWIVTDIDRSVFTDDQVERWFIEHHFEAIEPYLIGDKPWRKKLDGVASETFQYKEPEKFTILFMIGFRNNFNL